MYPPNRPSEADGDYDAFLVLDIEATCQEGSGFDFPNEIIEFPVCLMRWKEGTEASQLEVVAEFRSFVKPTWRPILSKFCKGLTGITQDQVNSAPSFHVVLNTLQAFMIQHGLIDDQTGERLVRFCWCSDGPFDIRDFVIKQCFISQIPVPNWLVGRVLDVRATVRCYTKRPYGPMDISIQLEILGLTGFEGRKHSGIDDTRNIARIVAELARRGIPLIPNTDIDLNRSWPWMGEPGQILEGHWRLSLRKVNDEIKPRHKLEGFSQGFSAPGPGMQTHHLLHSPMAFALYPQNFSAFL